MRKQHGSALENGTAAGQEWNGYYLISVVIQNKSETGVGHFGETLHPGTRAGGIVGPICNGYEANDTHYVFH